MTSHQEVIQAGAGDAGTLSQVIAEAFVDLPPARWLIPDPPARRRVFPGYFRLLVEHALAHGVASTVPARTAVALWLPVGQDGPGQPGGYPAALAAATGPWSRRFEAFDAELDRHHPTGAAHQYLAVLAVCPQHQGQGTGAALLRAHHTHLDQAGAPAYLEAASPRNRALYQRHGYTLRPGAPFHLPDHGPAMWPMWRAPGTT
ncbi:MAG TPA: GNAT family N-acetyltransferase [Streptosporangiaceae bacterium]